MKDYLINWLNTLGIVLTPLQMSLTLLAFILIISVVIHLSFHQVVIKLIKKLTRQSRQTWRKILFEKKLFSRLAFIVQGIILYMQVSLWLNPKGIFYSSLQTFSLLWITLFITLSLFSLVDVFAYLTRKNKRTRNLP